MHYFLIYPLSMCLFICGQSLFYLIVFIDFIDFFCKVKIEIL
uniref:Uncharacterized protein n=1 Tax=Anguilla anguilla TaxID=7936 RepID=A0A0E9SF47_ANGAN